MNLNVPLLVILFGVASQAASTKKRLFFGDYDSSESSASSNSTEGDDWLDSLIAVFGPFSTTTRRPGGGTKIPLITTTLRPPIIKCSEKPTEPCPTDCLTDSAIIHGFCCNCKNPTDPKVKPPYLCPASTACPSNSTKLCDLFSRLMTCCCKDAFTPKPTSKPPSKPGQKPTTTSGPSSQKPSSTDSWPTPPTKPASTSTTPLPSTTSATAPVIPTTQKPSSNDLWPTPPTKPMSTSTTPLPSTTATTPLIPSLTTSQATTTPLPSSSEKAPETSSPPTSSTPPAPPPTTPSSISSTSTAPNPLPSPPTTSATTPAPLPTPPTDPSTTPQSSGKSQQIHIVVDIDSASVQDEEIDLPLEIPTRSVSRRLGRAISAST